MIEVPALVDPIYYTQLLQNQAVSSDFDMGMKAERVPILSVILRVEWSHRFLYQILWS